MKTEAEPRRRLGGFVRYRLPAVLWTTVILLLSTAAASSQRTESSLAALIFWLLGHDPSFTTLEITNTIVRKMAHLVAYAVEAALILRAVRHGRPGLRLSWIAQALALTLLVAGIDEFNQSRSPGRSGVTADVVLDLTGGAIAMMIAHACIRH